ncbi:MAG: glycosyltransferase family 4 protein [Bacteroidota bacterium]
MHILYLHQYFCPPGGSGNNRSLELARRWVEAGHQVTFLTSPAYFPETMRRSSGQWKIELEGIPIHVLNVDYRHLMPFRQRLRAFLQFYRAGLRYRDRLPRPDLIYASSTPLTVGELGRKYARHWRIPFVYECVDVWPDVPIGMGYVRNPLLIGWLNRRTNRIYREAAEVVTLSEGMAEQILSHGVPAEKVHVVHNGCDPRAFPYIDRGPKAEVQVIYAGTVGVANGADAIVRAARMIWEQGRRDIRFVVLGQGNDRERVQALAERTHVPNLRFLDRVPKEEVAALLAASDIGLITFAPFPVLEANSANKFYDYLASGLPVVTNYRGWQAGYLEAWACGRPAPMGDEAQLVANILELADDPQMRRRMGRKGRELVLARFDRRVLADRLLDLFEGVRVRG